MVPSRAVLSPRQLWLRSRKGKAVVALEHLEACPYCASPEVEPALPCVDRLYSLVEELEYARCRNCRILFLATRVKESDLGQLYPEAYQPYRPETVSAASSGLLALPARAVLLLFHRVLPDQLRRSPPTTTRLPDQKPGSSTSAAVRPPFWTGPPLSDGRRSGSTSRPPWSTPCGRRATRLTWWRSAWESIGARNGGRPPAEPRPRASLRPLGHDEPPQGSPGRRRSPPCGRSEPGRCERKALRPGLVFLRARHTMLYPPRRPRRSSRGSGSATSGSCTRRSARTWPGAGVTGGPGRAGSTATRWSRSPLRSGPTPC